MKRNLNCPRIHPSSQNALNLLHFPRRFDIIRKHGKLVWLSRQSDSLVMNRSAVRIRPPAPQKPARLSGFPCSLWAYSYRSLTQVYPTRKSQIFPRGTPTSPARLRSQIRCAACAIPSRSRSLRIRPPAPHSRKASIAAPRKVLRGVCVCYLVEKLILSGRRNTYPDRRTLCSPRRRIADAPHRRTR